MNTNKLKKYRLMEAVALFYFVIITLVFLVAAGMCSVYLVMGLRQIALGKTENSGIKKKAGLRTFIISSSLLLGIIIFYVVLVF
jgi:hypothetical protein